MTATISGPIFAEIIVGNLHKYARTDADGKFIVHTLQPAIS
jgi:hypothetical protein